MSIPARQRIIARLYEAGRPVALHELDIDGVSQTSASVRLREMAREKIVIKVRAEGKHYDLWMLPPNKKQFNLI